MERRVKETYEGSIYLRETPDNYFDALDEVDDWIRLLHRREVWRRKARKFRRRVKVQFT